MSPPFISSDKPTVEIEVNLDPDLNTFHAPFPLTFKSRLQSFQIPLKNDEEQAKFGSIEPIGQALVKALGEAEGIAILFVQRHSLSVLKKNHAKWPDIEALVMAAVVDSCNQVCGTSLELQDFAVHYRTSCGGLLTKEAVILNISRLQILLEQLEAEEKQRYSKS